MKYRLMTEADVRKLIRNRCADVGGQSEFARMCGVRPQFVSMVLAGNRSPSEAICKVLGVRDDGRRYVKA